MRKWLWRMGWVAIGGVIGWGGARWYAPCPTIPSADQSADTVKPCTWVASPSGVDTFPGTFLTEKEDSLPFVVRVGWLPATARKWNGIIGHIDSVAGLYFYTLGHFSDSSEARAFAEMFSKRAWDSPLVIKK